MKVKRVEFVGAIADPGGEPAGRKPQIAIAGRSNVGKSSLINAALGRKKLARVSRSPGKTQQINFYEVNGRFCLVDLPGYGFAKVPARVRQEWGPLIETYLGTAEELLGVVQLVDCRHGPTDDDAQMLEFLKRLEIPTLFVLTKIDKLTRSERRDAVSEAREALGIPEDQLLVTSAVTGEGTADLLDSMGLLVEEATGEERGKARSGQDAVTPG